MGSTKKPSKLGCCLIVSGPRAALHCTKPAASVDSFQGPKDRTIDEDDACRILPCLSSSLGGFWDSSDLPGAVMRETWQIVITTSVATFCPCHRRKSGLRNRDGIHVFEWSFGSRLVGPALGTAAEFFFRGAKSKRRAEDARQSQVLFVVGQSLWVPGCFFPLCIPLKVAPGSLEAQGGVP